MDKFTKHEAMHTAYIFSENIGNYLMENEYVQSQLDCKELAEQAHQALFNLYQLIGSIEDNELEDMRK